MCKELGKNSNGWKDTDGTQTVRFLSHEKIAAIPSDRTNTYATIVVDYPKQKRESNRIQLTTRAAHLTTSKVLWNRNIRK